MQYFVGVVLASDAITVTVRLPRRVAERIEREARNAGLSLEEYLLDLALQVIDPKDKAHAYIEAAQALIEQAREEIRIGNARQAAEKAWGAAALAVKAYAAWRDGRRLTSHGELWEYKRVMERELGEWVYDSWNAGQSMHVCFYEGWCDEKDVENALERIQRLVREVKVRIERRTPQ